MSTNNNNSSASTAVPIDSSILGRLMNCWDPRHPILPGFDCILAYIYLRYFNTHPATASLYAVTSAFVERVLGHRERFTHAELQPLREAFAAFPAIEVHEILDILPITDPYRPMVRKHIYAHQRKEVKAVKQRARLTISAARRQEIQAVKAARIAMIGEAAYRAEVGAQRRARQIGAGVFVHDPDGGIHLRAFAADRQNVHRSSTQEATREALQRIMKRSVPTGQDTLAEVTVGMPDGTNRALLVETFARDYLLTSAFDIRYCDVADRVWLFIKEHKERVELTKRLCEEVCEGMGMCSNGKMARLLNVVRGFDEELTTPAPPTRDLFQARMAKVLELPVAERESAARKLFVEFHILEAAEQAPWLEALEEMEEIEELEALEEMEE